MRAIKAVIGQTVRVHNAPDGHVFGDGATVPAGTGGTPYGPTGGSPADTTATGKYRKPTTPDATETTVSTIHDATGIYYFDLVIDLEGTWFARIDGTATADELRIDVAGSAFAAP